MKFFIKTNAYLICGAILSTLLVAIGIPAMVVFTALFIFLFVLFNISMFLGLFVRFILAVLVGKKGA